MGGLFTFMVTTWTTTDHSTVKFNKQWQPGLQGLSLKTVSALVCDQKTDHQAKAGAGGMPFPETLYIHSLKDSELQQKGHHAQDQHSCLHAAALETPLSHLQNLSVRVCISLSLFQPFTQCFFRKETGWCTQMSDAGETFHVFEVLSLTQEVTRE